MAKRVKYSKTLTGHLRSQVFQASTETIQISIHESGTSLHVIINGEEDSIISTENLAEAKKLGKKFLVDSGVVFESEVRRKKNRASENDYMDFNIKNSLAASENRD